MRADETPAAELWQRTLAQIPSVFGRLVYLASLRNANTGVYEHFGFSQRFGERESGRTIKHSHVNMFRDWLCFSLEEQKDDLERYLDSADGDRRTIVATWLEWPPFMNWIPAQTRPVERKLFQTDMEVVLDLIRREYAVASPGQDASPRR
jgi:hypothetical protein